MSLAKITDVPSSITVPKTANPTVVQDSGPVTFTVVVRNDPAVDTVYMMSLGARVAISGKGIDKVVRTGKSGRVSTTIAPSQSGIIRVSIRAAKACNTQRIGVVGVIEPPVTG